MVVAVLVLASGYFVGGAVGDFAFKRSLRGRLLVSAAAVVLGAILMLVALNIPLEEQGTFLVVLSAAAVFIPFAAPNVTSSIHDITVPEIRGTALAMQNFVESAGAALAPWIAGLVAVRSSLKTAILLICVSTWMICALVFCAAAYMIPRDIQAKRDQLRQRVQRKHTQCAAAEGAKAVSQADGC
jgi:MFS family permease